jgi:hypothetical protein
MSVLMRLQKWLLGIPTFYGRNILKTARHSLKCRASAVGPSHGRNSAFEHTNRGTIAV